MPDIEDWLVLGNPGATMCDSRAEAPFSDERRFVFTLGDFACDFGDMLSFKLPSFLFLSILLALLVPFLRVAGSAFIGCDCDMEGNSL